MPVSIRTLHDDGTATVQIEEVSMDFPSGVPMWEAHSLAMVAWKLANPRRTLPMPREHLAYFVWLHPEQKELADRLFDDPVCRELARHAPSLQALCQDLAHAVTGELTPILAAALMQEVGR